MYKKVDVGRKILSANEEYALKNRRFFAEHKKLCLNMISSPGSGKTTILTKTITELRGKIKIGVIEGDIQTDLDAQRIRATNAPAVQIETEGACHLSAAQVGAALEKLPVEKLDLIFIENVGNLVCPVDFPLGSHKRVVVISVTEGDDMVRKHPAIFAFSDVIIINKVDLAQAMEVDPNILERDARRTNPGATIIMMDARHGKGMDELVRALGF